MWLTTVKIISRFAPLRRKVAEFHNIMLMVTLRAGA